MSKVVIPKIRFSGFDDKFESNQLDKLCTITTGSRDSKESVKNGKYNFYTCGIDILKINSFEFSGPAIIIAGSGSIGHLNYEINNFNACQRNFVLQKFKLYNWFLYYFLDKGLLDSIKQNVGIGAIPNILKPMLSRFVVNSPTNKIEQEKIGKFFFYLDNLINLTKNKYERLQNIKNTLLRRMFLSKNEFTPKIRFNEFKQNWVEKKLQSMGYSYAGLSNKTKEDFGYGHGKFITYLNVFSNPIIDINELEKTPIDVKQNNVQKYDILFTVSSETPEEVGMSSVCLFDLANLYLNSFCFGYRFNNPLENDPFYLTYMLRSQKSRSMISFLAQGISRYNISKNRILDINFPFPLEITEQQKIGKFLFGLDNLIKLNKVKHDKLQNIKKALLQKMFC